MDAAEGNEHFLCFYVGFENFMALCLELCDLKPKSSLNGTDDNHLLTNTCGGPLSI